MELPDPIIPFSMYKKFIDSFSDDVNENIKTYQNLLENLPLINYSILDYLLNFLVEIAKFSDSNLMHFSNLGVVFGPSLIRPEVPDTFTLMSSTNANIIEFFVRHYEELFHS